MLPFEKRVEKFISIYNIPIEENWSEYLQNNYKNYYEYMIANGFTKYDTQDIPVNNYVLLEENNGIKQYLKRFDRYYLSPKKSVIKIADVGCGWGFLSFWLLLSGAKEINAIGFQYQIDFLNKLKEKIKEKNLFENIDRLKPVAKPLIHNLKTIGDLPSNYLNLVIYNEVFEHIPDDLLEDAIKASYNTLSPGGKLISITHNTDNPQVFASIQKYWDRVDSDLFLPHRKKLIKDQIPEITEEELMRLATATRGLLSQAFNKAVSDYKINKKIPKLNKLLPAVDLNYDYICENFISPKEIIKKMQKTGFKSSVYCELGTSRKYFLFRPLVRMFKKTFLSINKFSHGIVFEGYK